MPVDLSRTSLARLTVTALLLVLLIGMGLSRISTAGATHDGGYDDGYNDTCEAEASDRFTIDGDPLNICVVGGGYAAGFDNGSHDALTYSGLFLFGGSGQGKLLDTEVTEYGEPAEAGGTITKQDELVVLEPSDGALRANITQTTSYTQGSDTFDVRYEVTNPAGSGAPFQFRSFVTGRTHLGEAGTPEGEREAGPPVSLIARNDPAGAENILRPSAAADHFSISDDLPSTSLRQGTNLSDGTTISEFSPWSTSQYDDRWDTPLAPGETETIEVAWKLKRMTSLQIASFFERLALGATTTLVATFYGADGDPVQGKAVQWSVEGVNPQSALTTTNDAGQATLTYTGSNEGLDRIDATTVESDPAKTRSDTAYRAFGGRTDDTGEAGGGGTTTTNTTTTQTTTTPIVLQPGPVILPAPKDPTTISAARLKRFLAGGLRVRARATGPSRWKWNLYRRRAGARTAQAGRLIKIATASDRATWAGQRVSGKLRVSKKTRKQLRKARRVTLVLRTTVTPTGGAPVTTSQTLKVKK